MKFPPRATRLALLCVMLVPSMAIGQGSSPAAASVPPAPTPLDTTGMFRGAATQVGENMFVSGQPTEAALRQLKAQGVTVVVNLRTPQEMQTSVPFDEGGVARELGMTYLNLPVRGTPEFPYAPSALDAFATAMREANGKVLLHCTIGARASHLWAAYLIRERGVPVDDALAHARLINFGGIRPADGARLPVEDFLGYALPQIKR